jgi:hypothetical protein
VHKYQSVPCHAEWFRYIQWHNMAYATTKELLHLPVHYLYYDDYTKDFNKTVQALLVDTLQYTAISNR